MTAHKCVNDYLLEEEIDFFYLTSETTGLIYNRVVNSTQHKEEFVIIGFLTRE
jgi:hypothetical protein